MPMEVKKSGLMAKYGSKLQQAAVAHADDPVDYGFQPVPAGITRGIAQLVECKFDVYKTGKTAGEYYFRAAGVVIEPKTVMKGANEITVEGMQTSIMEPVCDTTTADGKKTTTIEEHVSKIQNEMKKLGGPGFDVTDLESAAAMLKEAAPYFYFSTTVKAGTNNPDGTVKYPEGVWENWHGSKGLEDYVPEDAGGTVDNSATPPPIQPKAAPPTVKPTSQKSPTKPSTAKAPPPPAPEPDQSFNEFEDMDSLVAAANEDVQEAKDKLTELAMEAGHIEEVVAAADSWDAVVEMINNPVSKGEGEATTEEPWVPAVGEVYYWQPPKDPKNPKKVVKKVEATILTVNPKTSTVTIKRLDTGKAVMDVTGKKPAAVSWDDLSGEE